MSKHSDIKPSLIPPKPVTEYVTPAYSSVFPSDKYRKTWALHQSLSHRRFPNFIDKYPPILSVEIFIAVSPRIWQVLAQPGHFVPSLLQKLQVREGHSAGSVSSASFYFCGLKCSMADCTDLIFFPLL